jgi:hypothetical protein
MEVGRKILACYVYAVRLLDAKEKWFADHE